MHGDALLFPGQGSQTDDMEATVARHHPALLEEAQDVVAPDLFDRVDEGTDYAQPAIFCATLARWRSLDFPTARFLAGHSLGEIAALVAAGCLSDQDGLHLVTLRGRLMQEAIDQNPGCGMLAVRAGTRDVLGVAERSGATVANDNGPRQVILSGSAEALDAAADELRALGIRATRLPVAGAFHSPLMASAVDRYAAALRGVEIRPPRCTVVSCATASPFEDIRWQLAAGITAPVRWRETVLALAAAGAQTFAEIGPGRVLSGLVARILDAGHVVPAEELEPVHA